jgi:subfamily B ATP-binding cassette protein MsbA
MSEQSQQTAANQAAAEPIWANASSWEVYRRLLGYSLNYWQRFTLAIVGMFAYAGADSSFMWLIKPLLDGSFVERDPEVIRWMPLAILVLFIARGSGGFLTTYFMTSVAQRVVRKMRNEIFQHYMRMPTSFFEGISSGQLLAKLTFHVEQVAQAATSAVTTVIRDSLTALGLIIVMFIMSWKLSLFVLIVGPIIAVIIGVVSKHFRRYAKRIQSAMGDLTTAANESISAQREIKIFSGQQLATASFEEATNKTLVLNMKVALVESLNSPIIQFIGAWSVAGIIYFATGAGGESEMSAGTFVAFLGATIGLLGPIKRLSNVNVSLQKGIAAASNIFELLQLPAEIDDGGKTLTHTNGHLRLENIRFRYDGADEDAVKGIDLDIQPGQTVALVGQSGSGKTTLVSLIPRFYDVTSGRITLDGEDIRNFQLKELRRHMAAVSQQVMLFNDSIRNNIAYGKQGEASDAEIEAAAKAANAWDFIQELPQGLDTQAGEDGVMLSGGQRQRIAIARALLKNAPILILDEATSALDTETERKIQNALETLMQDRTTLVVAHRLSTIEKADKIVVMEKGAILEAGNHQELLDADGHYARLYRLQFSEQNV